MTETELIQRLLAPVLIIPACGLLILSTSARFTSLLARVRSQHAERLEVYRAGPAATDRDAQVLRLRLEGLKVQTTRMLWRIRMQRNALLLLFGAVVCMVLTSLLLGVGVLAPVVEYGAGVFFVLGLLLIAMSMALSMIEVADALTPIRYEHDRVEALCSSEER